MSCADCRWWTFTGRGYVFPIREGKCRARPPTTYRDTTDWTETVWPQTTEHDFCGSFQRAAQSPRVEERQQ